MSTIASPSLEGTNRGGARGFSRLRRYSPDGTCCKTARAGGSPDYHACRLADCGHGPIRSKSEAQRQPDITLDELSRDDGCGMARTRRNHTQSYRGERRRSIRATFVDLPPKRIEMHRPNAKKYGANASARVSLAQPADPQYNADLAGRLAQLVEQLTLNQRVRGSSPRSPSRELCKGRAWLSGFCRRHFSGPLPRPAASRCAAARPKYVTRRHAGFSGEAEFLAATGQTIVSPNHQSSSSSTVRFFHYINKLKATPRALAPHFARQGETCRLGRCIKLEELAAPRAHAVRQPFGRPRRFSSKPLSTGSSRLKKRRSVRKAALWRRRPWRWLARGGPVELPRVEDREAALRLHHRSMRRRRRQTGGPPPTLSSMREGPLAKRATAAGMVTPGQRRQTLQLLSISSHGPRLPNPVPERRELPTGIRQRPGHGSSPGGRRGRKVARLALSIHRGRSSQVLQRRFPRFALRAPAEPGRAPWKKGGGTGASIPSNFRGRPLLLPGAAVWPFAAGRRPDGWPWGGICENGGLGAANSQFSAPEFGANSRP